MVSFIGRIHGALRRRRMRKRARDKKIELVPANTNTHIPANIAPPLDHYSSRCMSQLDLSIHTLASSAGLGLDLPNEWIISDEINDLNDDILAEIFERVENVPPEHLASVCRRWRTIMFRLVRLWATIHPRLSPEAIRWRMSRSGRHGSHVVIGSEEKCLYPGLSCLFQNQDQWRSLTLFLSEERSRDDLLAEMQVGMRNVYLPNLYCLDATFDEPTLNIFGNPSASLSLFTNWSMPNLRTLRLLNMLPTHTSTTSLIHCSISLDSRFALRSRDFFVNLSPIHRFLVASTSLETLELAFSSIKDGIFQRPPREPIHLPLLRKFLFHLAIRDCNNLDELSRCKIQIELAEMVHAPNLEELDLFFMDLSSLGLYCVFDRLTRRNGDCKNLHSLTVEVKGSDDGVDVLGCIFNNLPQIKTLTVKGTMVTTWSAVLHPVSLRTIVLKSISDTDGLLLKRIWGLLQLITGPVWSNQFPDFDKIVVQDCNFFHETSRRVSQVSLRQAQELLRCLEASDKVILG